MFQNLPVNVRGWCCGFAGAGCYLGLLVIMHGLNLFDWLGFFPVQTTIFIILATLLQAHHSPASYRRTVPAHQSRGAIAGQTAFVAMFWMMVFIAVFTPNAWMRAKPLGDPATADVWVVFGFGLVEKNGTEQAGESNLALADWLLEQHDGTTPIIVQHGITLALQQREQETGRAIPHACLHALPHHPDMYVNTRAATQQTLAVMRELDRQKPLLAAHDLQLQRMKWDFAKFGCDDVVIPAIPPIPFDKQSTQHWGTENAAAWTVWEIILARPATGHGEWLIGLMCFIASAIGWRAYREGY